MKEMHNIRFIKLVHRKVGMASNGNAILIIRRKKLSDLLEFLFRYTDISNFEACNFEVRATRISKHEQGLKVMNYCIYCRGD
jgi:hypothetical protein